jgi:RNA polymerase subunit RPABC4/transcription elongation factor Spt4
MGSWYNAFQNLPCPGCTRRIPGNTTRCPYCTSELEWVQVGAGSTSTQLQGIFIGILGGTIVGGGLGIFFYQNHIGLGAAIGCVLFGFYCWHRAKTKGIDALIIKPNYQSFRPTRALSNLSNNEKVELRTTQSYTSTCHQCNSPRNDADLFCFNCGEKYINLESSNIQNHSNICHQCHSLRNDGDLFCIHCGTKYNNYLDKKISTDVDEKKPLPTVIAKLIKLFLSLTTKQKYIFLGILVALTILIFYSPISPIRLDRIGAINNRYSGTIDYARAQNNLRNREPYNINDRYQINPSAMVEGFSSFDHGNQNIRSFTYNDSENPSLFIIEEVDCKNYKLRITYPTEKEWFDAEAGKLGGLLAYSVCHLPSAGN